MRIAIIQFPGSNCERETILAVQRANMEPIPFLWNEPVTKLQACDGYIIVGGFSYEDRGRAGMLASLDPVMHQLTQAAAAGKPVLGICNGAQILVEGGLIPGIVGDQLAVALTTNKRVKNNHILGTGYYNDWIYVTASNHQPRHAFLRHLKPYQPIHIPTAHGEGRFILATGLWEKIRTAIIGILQYCNQDGAIKNEFPFNPNGSQHNLAALSNATGNVMAIMPHPERTTAGDLIFKSMHDYILENSANNYHLTTTKPTHLEFVAPTIKPTTYTLPDNAMELIVELIINDNTAISIQKALCNLQFKVKVKRYTHWEIIFTAALHDSKNELGHTKQAIIDSCELFNPNKEALISKSLAVPASSSTSSSASNIFTMLVQDQDNIIGKHKLEVLRETFGLKNILDIKHGNLWQIAIEQNNDQNNANLVAITEFILHKHVLFNPYSQYGFIID